LKLSLKLAASAGVHMDWRSDAGWSTRFPQNRHPDEDQDPVYKMPPLKNPKNSSRKTHTEPFELGPDLHQGDGVWGGVSDFLPPLAGEVGAP